MRKLLIISLTVIVFIALCGVALDRIEINLVYAPRPDRAAAGQAAAAGFLALEYHTAQGRQTAFYHPPSHPSEACHLWVLFSGSGSCAMESWPYLVKAAANGGDAFLLLDYPGSGLCEGRPSIAGIDASAAAALTVLREKTARPLPPLRALGYSLGTGPALRFAANHDVDRVILLAPYTSIGDAGRHLYGFAPDIFIFHNFDNRASLARLATRKSPPRVIIIHGDADEALPVTMSEELARCWPSMVQLHIIPGADHGGIFVLPLILSAMEHGA
jgi:alpha-beta hydrolase superfamily lysophospholipase